MEKRVLKINIIMSIVLLVLAITMVSNVNITYAASPFTSDGVYIVPTTNDMKMGSSSFGKDVKVEKIGSNYYMTFTVLKSSSVSNVRLDLGGDKIGEKVKNIGEIEEHTYTLSLDDLQGSLPFKAFVNAMKMEVEFNIQLDLASAIKTSDPLDKQTERPARFIPTITTTAGNSEMEKGSIYTIPKGTATITGKAIPVTTTVYYEQNGDKIDVEINNGRFLLDKVGKYHLIYRAESDKYKTNLGNNTFNELDIIIQSKVGATSLAKIENIGDQKVLEEGTTVQAGMVTETSDIYKTVQKSMEKISDHFEVISVEIFNEDGTTPTLNDNIALYLNANSEFDRSKIEVYYLDENGNIEQINCDGYGRYVRLETNKVGNYIICVPGVAFHMPMWGYALITVFAVIILIVIIVVPIVVTKKKKKKQKNM